MKKSPRLHLNLESSSSNNAPNLLRVKIEQERKEVDVLFCGCRSTMGPVGFVLRRGKDLTHAYTAAPHSRTRAN